MRGLWSAPLPLPRYPSLRRIEGRLSFPRDMANVGGITGFDALEFVGQFSINDNQRITVVSGFNRLAVCNGSFTVNNNDHLATISGFNGLVSVRGGLRIAGSYNADGHPSVAGFNLLEAVPGELYIGRIRSLSGFGALARAGSLVVENNEQVLAFPTFNALQTVPGNFYIRDNRNVRQQPLPLCPSHALHSTLALGVELGRRRLHRHLHP